MKYDFDRIIDRKSTSSLKWDIKDNELPMWVADMDFEVAPEIKESIINRANNGIFGYSTIPQKWNDSICNWWKRRHNFTLQSDWLIFCTGVIPALSSIVRKLTTPGENVLVQTPVYNNFFTSIENNGRKVVENKLIYKNSEYSIDFNDLEEKLSDPQTSLMFLCNPQNPGGVIWDRETLFKIGEICKENNVIVVSDEIHCDITNPGVSYVPFASVSETCKEISVTCISASKAFNIAGMQSAAVFIPNKFIRHKVWRGLNTDEVAEPNAFAIDATIAAFSQSEEWLDNVCKYIYDNKKLVENYIKNEIKCVSIVNSQATYLLWIDCSSFCNNSKELASFIREKTGLWLSAGDVYRGNGNSFLRMNIACPKSSVEDGLIRLKKGIDEYKKVK